MTVLATSELGAIIPFLFILACPLMMIFMMRGMHGSHSHGRGEVQEPLRRDELTLDELKRERDQLNEQIAQRAEQAANDARREEVFR